ncbi:hypothetical protein N9189_04190, partial [Pirellulaceae bacterium]|nr:hypothetical protein [Pirellulaceae bacterium]
GTESASAGAAAAFDSFFLVVAMIFFILEVVMLVYGIIIAINCTKGGAERVVHVVLAIGFTFPYVLIMSVFNGCAKSVLKGNTPNLNEQVKLPSTTIPNEYSTYQFGPGREGCQACSLNKV